MIRPNPITPAEYYVNRYFTKKQKLKRKFLKQYGDCYKRVIHELYGFLNREKGRSRSVIIPNHFSERIYYLIKKRLNKKLKKTGWHVIYYMNDSIFSSRPLSIVFELT